ncbi:hypothetical protein PG991_006364 [Apiospora marii]|uniref:Heterokaryon incompatibility domain-containing protein n=1 Tax=Apiospora marii TaxID=335849 RepID=A0ABR1SDD8_9PEZI
MATNVHKHHDAFGRLIEVPPNEQDDEKYLNPESGKLVPLVVQEATNPTLKPVGAVSLLTRMSQWAHSFSLDPLLSPIPPLYRATVRTLEYGGTPGTGRWRRSGRLRKRISKMITLAQWAESSPWAWVTSCFLLFFVYAKVARNRKEDRREGEDDETYRLLLQNPDDGEMSVTTAYNSTISLVSKAQRNNQKDIEMGYWTSSPYADPANAFGGRQTFEHTTRPPSTRTTSQASTAQASSTTEVEKLDEENMMKRGFGPSHLCFLKYDKSGAPIGYETSRVDDWVDQHGGHSETDFVFLSYTRAQFGVFTEDWLNDKNITDIQERKNLLRLGDYNRATLERHGIEAAHKAGLKAFWWDFKCIPNTDGSTAAKVNNPEVYRICEVARAAHSMVILVGPSRKPQPSRPFTEEACNEWLDECAQMYSPAAFTEWMQVWGSRMWTLPEILLVPPQRPVKIFAIGGPNPPEQWEKRNFAARSVWKDATRVRQLIDHYESAIHLEPLELLSIALECFQNRVQDKRFDGDAAYALMGLLRRRPEVNTTDSEFEAFARLSLANDSEAFLERLVCVQPLEPDKPWHYQKDFWGSKLWDIQPKCQVAGIADDETVILDGAYGATIRWNSMEPVYFFTRRTWKRTFSQWVLRSNPGWLAIWIALALNTAAIVVGADTAAKQRNAGTNDNARNNDLQPSNSNPTGASSTQIWTLVIIMFFLFVTIGISLAAPAMIRKLYIGKFWDTQASFVGMEGVPSDLGMVEEYLFGCNRGRLEWSVAGSTLSRHKESTGAEKGACIGLPPRPSYNMDKGGNTLHTFTIVDTFSMTAMAFQAARPPTAVIVCGQEGGMQRAALCSYDWKRNTFSREQVIRLKTAVLDRMSRMDRFRFSFKRRYGGLASPK